VELQIRNLQATAIINSQKTLPNLNPSYAVEIVGQQIFSIISSAHGLFWIVGIADYFEMQNKSKCLRLKNP
jgi:hypothetical protein